MSDALDAASLRRGDAGRWRRPGRQLRLAGHLEVSAHQVRVDPEGSVLLLLRDVGLVLLVSESLEPEPQPFERLDQRRGIYGD